MRHLSTSNYFSIPGFRVPGGVTAPVLNEVINYFKISDLDLLLKSKKQKYVYPRQLFHWLCDHMKKERKMYVTYQEIAGVTKQNHATVLHSIKSINNHLTYDKKVIEDIRVLKSIIKS